MTAAEQPTPGSESPMRVRAKALLARVIARLNEPDSDKDQAEAWSIIEDELQSVAAQRAAEAVEQAKPVLGWATINLTPQLAALGYEASKLQFKWRTDPPPVPAGEDVRTWWRELELAICDALVHEGGINAYPGDGVCCVAQIVHAYAKQAPATPPPGDAGERARNHPDDCLPDCMMPDGGEACEGYQHARKLLADAQTKITALQSERTAAASQARRETLAQCMSAARGEDANRGAANEIAAAYIQGRLDAVSDIRALATPQESA